jgi:hypothetical protein
MMPPVSGAALPGRSRGSITMAIVNVWAAGSLAALAAAVVIGVAALARIAVLIVHQPALSDDIYRYIFDGRNLAAGVNPHLVTPGERTDAAAERWPGESAVAAPRWLTYELEPLRNLLVTSERFGLKWAHFGGAYEPLLWTIEKLRPPWSGEQQEVLARRICLALVAAVLIGVWWCGCDAWAGARTMLAAMVLLSPATHPWCLLWALALVPMAFGPVAWVASLTLPWGYDALAHVSPDGVAAWGVSPWLMAAAYVPVYGVLAADIALKWKRARPLRRPPGPP